MTNTGETTFNIKKLYKRLQAIDLNKKSVRNLLPDWWCDEFEQEQGAVYEAAAYIAKRTSLNFDDLIDPDPTKKLAFRDSKPCYKLRQGTEESSLTISRAIAERLCDVVAFGTSNTLGDLSHLSAQAIRSQIMQNHEFVTLEGILEFCWGMGIAVIHAGQIPKGKHGKKFDGMVGLYGDRPVILIAKNSNSSARLAFILAHELGHIVCGHVQNGSSIVDEDINPNDREDDQEVEADEFAVALIYGTKNACYYCSSKFYPYDLVRYSHENSVEDKISPASVVLNYGWYKEKMVNTKEEKSQVWRLVGAALKEIEDQEVSASQIINNYLKLKLDWDRLGNDSQEFIERMAGIE